MASSSSSWRQEYPSDDGMIVLILEQKANSLEASFRLLADWPGLVLTLSVYNSGTNQNLALENGAKPEGDRILVLEGPKVVLAMRYTILDSSKAWNCPLMYRWRFGRMGAKWQGGLLSWPFASSLRTQILQGHDGKYTHQGEWAKAIDFGLACGEPVLSVEKGLVVQVVDNFEGAGLSEEYRERNNYIDVLHSDGTVARYVHVQKDSIRYKAGDSVLKGVVLALSGNVGYSGGPHLHFEIGRPLDGEHWETLAVLFRQGNSQRGYIPKTGDWVGGLEFNKENDD